MGFFGNDYYEENEEYKILTTSMVTYDDVKKAAISFKEGRILIINLAAAELEDKQRICDFCSGMVFFSDGQIKLINDTVLVVTPKHLRMANLFDQNIAPEMENDEQNV